MSSPPVLTTPPVQGLRHRGGAGRSVLTLFILSGMIVSWGCAGSPGSSPATLRCPASVQARITAAKPTLSVSYTEPSVSVEGKPLTDLAKTTIYYDLGSGRILAKEIPATKPTGGGQISQTITIPIRGTGEQPVRICVTATDHHGNESLTAP